jgi:hypothetical protein
VLSEQLSTPSSVTAVSAIAAATTPAATTIVPSELDLNRTFATLALPVLGKSFDQLRERLAGGVRRSPDDRANGVVTVGKVLGTGRILRLGQSEETSSLAA